MLEKILPFGPNTWAFAVSSLLLGVVGVIILYFILFNVLRSIFRRFERDIALVTLGVSAYPALAVFILVDFKVSIKALIETYQFLADIDKVLTAALIIAISYWLVQLFTKVVIYYLKEYTKQTEVMWDDVLLPLLDAVIPVIIFTVAGFLVLRSFGVDLTRVWVALGGAGFIIGFATKDILANFFSGIVLLLDTPFQFGDILRLEDGSIGMLRKIGVRVTKIYIFESHCDVYIPNSSLQAQNITNLSRPTTYHHYSTTIEIPSEFDLDKVKILLEDIILGHPDTLGDIDQKLECIEQYFTSKEERISLAEQQQVGKTRLIAENEVNLKLEEIDSALEALVVTIEFAEKGGLNEDEIDNIQQEYRDILYLLGLEIATEEGENRFSVSLEETMDEEELIELIRTWYRAWSQDPNLLDDDLFIIPEEWERKINILKRRVQRLYQKISNPKREETRLDDYVKDLIDWLKDRFKEPRKKWQYPRIKITEVSHDEAYIYVEFNLSFFIDDVKLEDGKRGDRVGSQIYQETLRELKRLYPSWGNPQEHN